MWCSFFLLEWVEDKGETGLLHSLMNIVNSGSCVLHHCLLILEPKRRAEQTLGIFIFQQGKEDIATLQLPAILCLYFPVLYSILCTRK